MEKEKWYEKLKAQGQSITVPMTLLMIAVAVIPLLLQTWILIGSFKQNQIEARSIEIQNQCVILSNRMTRSGYMTADKANNVSLDAQMQTIADLYNGRIVIVNSSYKIMTDTFNLSTGKYYISEEVIRCFKGESGSSFNKEGGYFYQTIPVYDPADEKKIQGVIAVTASMENVVSVTERVKSSAQLFFLCMALVAILFSIMSAHFLVRPFKRLLRSFDRVAQGDLDADISEDAYSETRQMSQAVQKSLRKLKAVDQSRQEFVSNVSHELKTPITSIRVLADSLMGMEDAPVELYREFMADISDEIDRENQIIEDLLTLVRMDKSAESQMNISQVHINHELEMILKRLRPIAKRSNVELILESIREVTADVDKVKLNLAVTNLVENAIKYNIDSGWVRVTLDADHKYFYVKVADSGIGIPEDSVDHIFERFFRVDKARSREVGGTGLGLSITKNVIQMHHGVIDVESTPGEGTVKLCAKTGGTVMKHGKRKFLLSILLGVLVAAMAVLSGCKARTEPKSDPGAGKYLIYYLNSSVTKLVAQEYETETKDQVALAEELVDQLTYVPRDLDCQTVLNDKVSFKACRIDEQVLYLYFDGSYTAMKPEQEILCRAALARTMTQIPGIDYISIYCGDQPLMDRQGNPVGFISAGDFIINTSNVNAYEKTELTLYFANSTGDKLVAEKREVAHNINTSMEQLIVEQLIAGPSDSSHQAVLPSDCKILSVSVTDNICYINFDSAFLNSNQAVNEYIPIYAIVNSLVDKTSVSKVQIMVNGSQDVMFREVVSLNTAFERNTDYIEQE